MHNILNWIAGNKDVLNVGLSLLTLIVVLWYTRAAYLQAEAPFKPCIRLVGTVEYSDETILSGEVVKLPGPAEHIQLRNVGPGPALNFRYKLRRIESYVWSLSLEGGGQPFDTGRTINTLDAPFSHFVALYDSLGGKTYETTATIHDRRVVRCATFRRSARWRRALRWIGDRWASRQDRVQRRAAAEKLRG